MAAILTRDEAPVSRDELERFHKFSLELIQRGEIDWTWRDLLDAWRRQDPDSPERLADLAAIREAIADMEAGEVGRPFEEFDREFRRQHNIVLDEEE